jgi:hypothetical protein
MELDYDKAECHSMMRPFEFWGDCLRRPVPDHNESVQALVDAIATRNTLFDSIPGVETAVLRGFRQPAREPPELTILGTV